MWGASVFNMMWFGFGFSTFLCSVKKSEIKVTIAIDITI